MPSKRKKMRQEKRKKKGGEKAKSKSQDCSVTFKPKNYLEILLSAHGRTSQADILLLDHKAAKCTTCKRFCGLLVLALYSTTVTREPLGKISRNEWVNSGYTTLLTGKKASVLTVIPFLKSN